MLPAKGETMRFIKPLTIIGVISCMLILSGCIVKDSPAPGCIESIGIPLAGGCFGKTAIVDLKVVSAPECVVVEVNNCNGGILEIRNTCKEAIQLDGIDILPSNSISLDIKEVEGSIHVIETDSNFSQYIPDVDKRIEITGVVGNQTIKLALTKTKPLCE
jgi:hypothetical protein